MVHVATVLVLATTLSLQTGGSLPPKAFGSAAHLSPLVTAPATSSSQHSKQEEDKEGAQEEKEEDTRDQTPTISGTTNTTNDTMELSGGSAYVWTPEGRKAKPVVPQDIYERGNFPLCEARDISPEDIQTERYGAGPCPEGMVDLRTLIITCPPDTFQLDDLFVRRVQPDGSYAERQFVSSGACVTPSDIAAQAQTAFTSMHVPAPAATLQSGNRTKLLVNAWYPVYVSDDVVTQTATLLDVPVEIRAFPAQYTWDFDDPFSPEGGTLTTINPGRPWTEGEPLPDKRWIAHAWTRLGDPDTRAGQAAHTTIENGIKARTDVHVTLETTWHGQFRIVGTTQWTNIPGELTTTSDAGTYMVTEARSRLVCDDLNGNDGCTL